MNNAAALLNELHMQGVSLAVTGPDRLRFEGPPEAVGASVLTALRECKREILTMLRKSGSTAKLLGRRCPLCRQHGMRIEETWVSELHYFDTFCATCEELVEVYIPAQADVNCGQVA